MEPIIRKYYPDFYITTTIVEVEFIVLGVGVMAQSHVISEVSKRVNKLLIPAFFGVRI